MKKTLLSGLILAGLSLSSALSQTVSEIYLPQYAINGNQGDWRLQTAARLSLGGLSANATYRYYVSGWSATDLATSSGAGNYYGIDNTVGAAGFIQGYTSSKSVSATSVLLGGNEFVAANRYSQFTTDASGNYTGWFALVPTGNARFTAGNSIQTGVVLNNGAGGTTEVTRLRTASTISMLGATNTDANAATMIIGDTLGTISGETMVLLYDNVGGAGRPVWGSWVESDGITSNFGLSETNATAGRWAAYVPNTLANGIRRVEYWDMANNTLVGAVTDDDGIWTSLSGTQFSAANGNTTYDGNLNNIVGISAAVPEPSVVAVSMIGLSAFALRRKLASRP